MKNILNLNPISPLANKALRPGFQIVQECPAPDAVIVRSFNMHEYDLAPSVLCIGRAGAGVNNIPVDKCSDLGVVVFNTPGANANAVKELVLCALMLGSRRIVEGINWVNSQLAGRPDAAKQVEAGKGKFVGRELLGKTIGIIGLGAIGALVANACVDLGMTVIGYDPFISIDAAWNLNNQVIKETDLDHLLSTCDYISLNLPMTSATKGMINAQTLALVKPDAVIVNCSRAELVDSQALVAALGEQRLGRYVTDFPTPEMIGVPNVINIPHLGASTPEAEDNCAFMATAQIVDYVNNGNITNSVNFPSANIPRSGKKRLTLIHQNVKSVLSNITELISAAEINISNMLSQAQGAHAYAILDLDDDISDELFGRIAAAKGIIRARLI